MRGPARVGTWVRVRIVGVAGVLIILLAGIGYRAWGLQISQADHYRELAHRQHIATVEVPAPRGAIYDATGAELAVTANIDSIYANPREVVDLIGTAETLSHLLEVDARVLEARLASPRYFAWVKRHVSPEEAAAVRAADLPGVYLTPEPRRFYPGRRLAGPLLGFAGIDGRGLDGLELTMNDLLAGQRASAEALRDAAGRVMLADPDARPRPGASVTLTLHRYVQLAAERALEKAVRDNRAKAGVIVVLDVKSGDILGLASWPTYDPNRPGERPREARNRAVTDVYEIGSVMKVFAVAAALDAGVVTPETTFEVKDGVRIGRKVWRDTYRDEVLTTGGVLKRSSNVGAIKIARRLGAERFHAALLELGFGAETEVELPGEAAGLVRDPDTWGEIGLATMSFGYGMSATPLQAAAAMAAVAGGGVYHPPRIIKEVIGEDGRRLYSREQVSRRVLSEKTAAAIRPMLASVFERGKHAGTAHSLRLDGYLAGGKTGTAYKIDPATGRYGDDLYLSSFAGFAPLSDPRVMTLVMIDEPDPERHYGAQVAGPAWVEVMNQTLKYLGVPAEVPSEAPPSKKKGAAAANQPPADDAGAGAGAGADADADAADADSAPQAAAQPGTAGSAPGSAVIPDFTGLGLADALELARERGIRLQVVGSGRAIEQFPPPGPAAEPAECRIVFGHEPRRSGVVSVD